MSEFWIVPDEVELHAQEVSAVAGQMGQAQQAAGTVTALSPQSFGLLCSFFTPPTVALSTAAIASMTGTQSALTAYATTLPVVAGDLASTDAAQASKLDSLRGELA